MNDPKDDNNTDKPQDEISGEAEIWFNGKLLSSGKVYLNPDNPFEIEFFKPNFIDAAIDEALSKSDEDEE